MSGRRVARAQVALTVGLRSRLVPGHGPVDEPGGRFVVHRHAGRGLEHAGAAIGPQLDDAATLEISDRLVVGEEGARMIAPLAQDVVTEEA